MYIYCKGQYDQRQELIYLGFAILLKEDKDNHTCNLKAVIVKILPEKQVSIVDLDFYFSTYYLCDFQGLYNISVPHYFSVI